jgi:hypothetical protein
VYCSDINGTEANPDIQVTFLRELLTGGQPRRPQGLT